MHLPGQSILLLLPRLPEMNFRDSIVRLVGEGYEQPHGDPALAIDINYARLNEWLVSKALRMVTRCGGQESLGLHT